MRRVMLFSVLLMAACTLCLADVDSGPTVGEKAPVLTVKSVAGEQAGEEVEWTKLRGNTPTVLFFVRSDKLTRPSARVMKKTDEALGKMGPAKAVLVMLTDDGDKTTKRLEAIQQSLKFEQTTLCLYAKNFETPEFWGVNSDADLTAVILIDGKVKQRFGWVGPNENVVDEVTKLLPKAVK